MIVPQVGGERPGLRSVGRGGVADFRVRRISQPEWFCDGIRVTYSTETQSDSRLVDRNMCIHTCERFYSHLIQLRLAGAWGTGRPQLDLVICASLPVFLRPEAS